MTDPEIAEIVDRIEKLWVEHYVATKYLQESCGIANPNAFLAKEAEKIPRKAGLYRMFEPVRLALGQGLHDTEVLQKLFQVLQEHANQQED